MIKERLAALAAKLSGSNTIRKADLNAPLQAGARSTQSTTLNYASVNTLDPSRLASAFAQADQGIITDQAALFELIEEQDPHIYAELAKRRRAVTGLGWKLEPPSEATETEIKRTAELADMLRSINGFEDAQYDITDAIGKGFTALEIEWKTGSIWLPKQLHWVPQRLFEIDRDSGEFKYRNMGIPEPLRFWGWVIHEHKSKSGYIEQAALFRVLAWTYAYKAYNVKDMQRFLEVYGLPLRLGKYPSGIGPKQRDELLRAVRNIGSDGAGVVPSNMTIEFIEAQTGKVSDFLDSIEYWERKQSMAILGGTLTSQADGKTSTNALGTIHDEVRREIMLHDVRQIEPTINKQLVERIAFVNGLFPVDRMPKFVYDTEETVNQKEMVEVLSKAAEIGMQIDVDYAHQVTQIPKAKDGAAILLPRQANQQLGQPLSPRDQAAALVRLAALAKSGVPQDITDAYATQLAKLCANNETGLIQNINALLGEHGDFESALAAMEQLAIAANTKNWADKLAKGMAVANLAGRSDVVDGQ